MCYRPWETPVRGGGRDADLQAHRAQDARRAELEALGEGPCAAAAVQRMRSFVRAADQPDVAAPRRQGALRWRVVTSGDSGW